MRRQLTILLVLLVAGNSARAAANPSQDLARARGELGRRDYTRVVATLHPQLYPTARIRDENELKEAHYLLGVAYYYLDKRDLSRQEFSAILYIDPSYSMDPVVEAPDVVAFFESLKGELEGKLQELEKEKQKQRQREEEARKRAAREVVIERTIRPASAWTNFVPFGVGQFRNGDKGKGAFFLTSELVLGGASIALFATQAAQYGIPLSVPPDERGTARTLQILQIGTGAAFLVVYAWGVVDAFTHQPPIIEEKRTERPLSGIVPFVTGDGGGIAGEWRF